MSAATRWQFGARYLAVLAPASLLWELAQMPLYTLWQTGSSAEIAFAVVHCTVGDVLIGTAALSLAVIFFGGNLWPGRRRIRVAVVTVILGLAYTLFSEWLNVELRQSWAYRDIMPTLPLIGTGLTPFLQWILVPLVAYRYSLSTMRVDAKNRPKGPVDS